MAAFEVFTEAAKLPILATYMGHVSIVSTQYYLHLIEPVATAAAERFARHCAGLVTPPAAALGGERCSSGFPTP